ncbi:MAG TPA: hypothetical protein ENJ31_03240 [Anaerolineae bacterium]|nr:hypothetical protein [Anaerolineae bacterium]
MKRKGTILLLVLILATVLAACGGEEPTPVVVVVTPGPTQPVVTMVVTPPPANPPAATEAVAPPTPPPAAGIEILEATFAHGLTDQMEPVNPGSDFQADETVYLSLKIKGRPKEGTVTARFYWNEDLIAEAGVDLADANSGLLFSIGEDTFVGYTLTHENPFPLGEGYRAEVFYNNQPLGTYAFRIAPPPEAIPSQIKSATLARGADDNYNPIDPTTTFASDETVYLVGRGDLGVDTWIQADWYIGGQLDENGTRSITVDDNYTDVGFSFSYLPEGGWPPGEHFVVLTMNGVEVGRYPFTIVSSGGAAPLDETAFWDAFPEPEDAEIVPVVEGFDLGFATAMPEPQLFDWYAAWLRDQGWQQQAPTEAMQSRPHQVWRKDGAEFFIEIQGVDDQGRTVVWFQLTDV